MLATLLPGFAGTVLPSWLRERLRAGLGGVCLYAQNITSPEQLRSLTGAIMAENPYAIIAVDEEGGDVTRLFAATGSLGRRIGRRPSHAGRDPADRHSGAPRQRTVDLHLAAAGAGPRADSPSS